MCAKLKGFRVLEKTTCKSRIDGYPTFKIFKCCEECLGLQKYMENPNKKGKPKELTRFTCLAEIQFK